MPVGGDQKKQFLFELQEDVIQYLEEHPNADQALLEEHFGAPDDIAEGFIAQMPSKVINDKFRVRNRVVAIVSAVAILITITWISTVLYMMNDAKTNHRGHGMESPAVTANKEESLL